MIRMRPMLTKKGTEIQAKGMNKLRKEVVTGLKNYGKNVVGGAKIVGKGVKKGFKYIGDQIEKDLRIDDERADKVRRRMERVRTGEYSPEDD